MAWIRKILCIFWAMGLTLGVYQEYITLWDNATNTPVEVYPYKASMLPPAEVQALESGIPIQDEGHLRYLLMNYLS